MHITLNTLGETPAKKNSKIFNTKTKRMFPSKKYYEWHDSAVADIVGQLPIGFMSISEPVEITMTFYHGDNRKRDCDNGCSSILDTLVDGGVLTDDNWFVVRQVHLFNRETAKNNAHCEIEIKTLDE